MQQPDFIRNAIDLHIHSEPDSNYRIGTSIDIAREAARAGMRAIVLKDHLFPSFTKAGLTDQVVEGIRVFGGITMNWSAGGLSVRSVRAAIFGGARVVMFPSYDSMRDATREPMSRNQTIQNFGAPRRAVEVVDANGEVVSDARDVMDVVAENKHVILSTGHLRPKEVVPVLQYATSVGIERIMLEHPNGMGSDAWSDEQIKAIKEAGGYFNMSYNSHNPIMGKRPFADLLTFIGRVGTENCTLITDGGQPYNPWPSTTMETFCRMLWAEGVPEEDIFTMVRDNPAKLLGLDEEPTEGAS